MDKSNDIERNIDRVLQDSTGKYESIRKSESLNQKKILNDTSTQIQKRPHGSTKMKYVSLFGVIFLMLSVVTIGFWTGYMIENDSKITVDTSDFLEKDLLYFSEEVLAPPAIFELNDDCSYYSPSSNIDIYDGMFGLGKDNTFAKDCSVVSDDSVLLEDEMVFFSIPSQTLVSSVELSVDCTSTILLPLKNMQPVDALTISCFGSLLSDEGFVRIIMVDESENLLLVFSTDAFGLDQGSFSVENIGMESLILDGRIPTSIVVEIYDAVVHLNGLNLVMEKQGSKMRFEDVKELSESQQQVQIRIWNGIINELGLLWVAEETEMAALSFSEKLALFDGRIPNLHGLEYYSGGLFSVGVPEKPVFSESTNSPEDVSVDNFYSIPSFDWRSRHDATDPCSTYFKYRDESFVPWFAHISNLFGMSPELWSEEHHLLHHGDFNGDGRIDILMQNRVDGGETYMLIATHDPWEYFLYDAVDITNEYGMSSACWSEEHHILHVADFNGDGYSDILLQGKDSLESSLLLIADYGDYTFISPSGFSFLDVIDITSSYGMSAEQWSAEAQIMHLGLFNDDDCMDVLLQNKKNEGMTYLLLAENDIPTEGYFTTVQDITQMFWMSAEKWSDTYRKLNTGDFNGDGLTDLLLQNRAIQGHATYLLFAKADGSFTNEVSIHDEFGMTKQRWADDLRLLHTGDFNGDGLTDVLLQNRMDGDYAFLLIAQESEPNTYNFFRQVVNVTDLGDMNSSLWSAQGHVVHVGEFNSDVYDDVLVQNVGSDDEGPFLLFGRNEGLLSCKISIQESFYMTSDKWKAEDHLIHVGDFNHNGCNDLLLQNRFDEGSCRILRGATLQPSGWMPRRTTTQICPDCWAFGPVYALQGMVNLYYNQLLDLDLSEQHVVSCAGNPTGDLCCGGWMVSSAVSHIVDTGVMLEENFPYNQNTNICPRPLCPDIWPENETINASDSIFWGTSEGEKKLKQNIIDYGSGAGVVGPWGHCMCLVGFGTVQAGELIYQGNIPFGWAYDGITVEPDSPFIGQTYWIFENSWGKRYLYVIGSTINSMLSYVYFFDTPITSSVTYNTEDIQILDEDNDGYYNWGIGDKPEGCLTSIPDEPDGNDNNPGLGPLNELAQCYQLGKNILIRQNGEDILGNGRYDFGRFAPGATEVVEFTIENIGDDDLVLTGTPLVSILGDENGVYSVSQPLSSSVISPGDSAMFSVEFLGAYGPLQKGIVSIESNDPYVEDYHIRLYGYGYEAWNYQTSTWYPTIQDAVNAAVTGDIIIVPDGEYFLDEEIIIDKAITVRSHHGADQTIMNAINYSNQIVDPHRCFKINNNDAVLSGFTIKNGHDGSSGGGVYLDGGSVDSCIFLSNVAKYGGGIYVKNGGSVDSCLFFNNAAFSGGAIELINGEITKCVIQDNFASYQGGGIYVKSLSNQMNMLRNCLINSNHALKKGGGIYTKTDNFKIDISTIVGNKAYGNVGGGIGWESQYNSPIVTNSIVCFNDAYSYPKTNNYGTYNSGISPTTFSYTCTYPVPLGSGNIDIPQQLFSLQGTYPFSLHANSPCIDAGNPSNIQLPAYDLAGNTRVVNDKVDLGAYEFQFKPGAEPIYQGAADIT
jgi:hypothetical protein